VSGCQSSDQAKQQLVIIALKAIGNAGVFIESTDTLRKCIQVIETCFSEFTIINLSSQCIRLTVTTVLQSGSISLMEQSGSVHACRRTAVPLHYYHLT
jgi:hypothetical protein